jgi:hypothetical protein
LLLSEGIQYHGSIISIELNDLFIVDGEVLPEGT